MPKVSIIIPTYNVEKYLVECMESVVNQTLSDIEIICIDDGSTDNSGKILDDYAQKDNRIKVIHKENGGYGKAMNVGLDNTTGEYIGIVEPDDYVTLEMYETLYNIAKEKDLDFIKSDFNRFVGEGDNLQKFYYKLDESDCYYNKIINLQNDITPFRFIMNTWSGIYKKEFLEKYNIRHNVTPGASFQDNGFWFQTFMYATRAYFLNRPFYMNRRDNPNSSVKNRAKVYALTEEYKYIRSIIDKNSDLKKFIGVYWVAKFNNYIFNINRIDKSFHKEFMKTFINEYIEAKNKNEIYFELFEEYGLLHLINMLFKDHKKFLHIITGELSIFEKIFSLKNKKYNFNESYKVITILGLQIKFKRRNKCQK